MDGLDQEGHHRRSLTRVLPSPRSRVGQSPRRVYTPPRHRSGSRQPRSRSPVIQCNQQMRRRSRSRSRRRQSSRQPRSRSRLGSSSRRPRSHRSRSGCRAGTHSRSCSSARCGSCNQREHRSNQREHRHDQREHHYDQREHHSNQRDQRSSHRDQRSSHRDQRSSHREQRSSHRDQRFSCRDQPSSHRERRSSHQRSRSPLSRPPAAESPRGTTERLNVLYERNWTRLVHAQLRKFESSVVAAARQADRAPADLLDAKWTYSGAIVYCITLITTIGYGNVSPKTAAGRAATVAYAAAGVPLALACLAGLGASLARLARLAWLRATNGRVPSTWRKDAEMENHFQLHEQQRLLPQAAEHNQYTSFPPCARSPGTLCARAGDRGQYQQVFQRVPPRPRAATLGRVRSAAPDEPQTSSAHQTQTLDRGAGVSKCLATVHCPGRGRGRGRGLPRPRGPLDQLIAEECGPRGSLDEDDSEDADESICPHDTPSRVPLICKEENCKSKSCAVPSSSASAGQRQHSGSVEHCHVPVSIVLFLLLAYICVGAAIFSAWENWSFLDAAYFCFIALATIGFGDFVPTSFLTSKQSESSKTEYIQMIACCAYLVFGLILIAMSFSLLQDEVVSRCSQLATSLGLSRQ